MNYRRYDDVAVGDVFPTAPLRFEISGGVVENFNDAVGSERASEIVPSMLASVYLVDLLSARRSPPGGIHAKQSIRFYRPLKIGETLSVQATVVEKYVRKERPYVVSVFEAMGEDGDTVSTGRITSIWGKDQ